MDNHILSKSKDAISRQAVIDAIDKWAKSEGALIALPVNEVTPLFDSIHKLSPVTPQPKIGKWIIMDIEDCELFMAKCSECGVIVDSRIISKHPYCHCCGAKMVEPQESEEV